MAKETEKGPFSFEHVESALRADCFQSHTGLLEDSLLAAVTWVSAESTCCSQADGKGARHAHSPNLCPFKWHRSRTKKKSHGHSWQSGKQGELGKRYRCNPHNITVIPGGFRGSC